MAAIETISKIKTDIRIKHTVLDNDVSDQIDACLADLTIVGIKNPSETDPTILNAIKLWCRSYYTDDTAKAADWATRYDALKACLMMAAGYGGAPDEV